MIIQASNNTSVYSLQERKKLSDQVCMYVSQLTQQVFCVIASLKIYKHTKPYCIKLNPVKVT